MKTQSSSLPLPRIGLYGDADDTVSVLGQPDTVHNLIWEVDRAPSLADISLPIRLISQNVPTHALLKTSCYAFARAVVDTVFIIFNGYGPRLGFLTSPAHFLYFTLLRTTRGSKTCPRYLFFRLFYFLSLRPSASTSRKLETSHDCRPLSVTDVIFPRLHYRIMTDDFLVNILLFDNIQVHTEHMSQASQQHSLAYSSYHHSSLSFY